MYRTLASFSLAAALSTVSALSFCCLTWFQRLRLTTATVWIKAGLQWYSLYLFSRFLCLFFLFLFFFWYLYLCSNTRTTYAFVTPAHSSGYNWNYLYNKQALFWKMPHSICESPSSLHFSTENWPESCWHQHKGAHTEWRLYLPYSNKQSLCSLLIQPAFRIYGNKITFPRVSVFWSVKRLQHFGK